MDLDIYSTAPLQPLVAAFGCAVGANYVGWERNRYSAHLDLAASYGKNADTLISAFTALVKKLPKAGRRLWNQAQSREFNIGIEAGIKPHSYTLAVSTEALAGVAEVGGIVVVTVYAPPRPPGSPGRRATPRG